MSNALIIPVVGRINESDKFGSESGSSGMYSFCDFPLRAEEYVSGVFSSAIFAPTGVNSKGGQLI